MTDRKREILAQRARAAAIAPAPIDDSAKIEFAEFSIGADRFGIEGCHVREVAPLAGLAFLPWAPPFVLGIVNMRGRIISLIDLARLLGSGSITPEAHCRIFVVCAAGREVGILANAAEGVRRIRVDSLVPPPPGISGVNAALCRGIAPGPVTIVDAVTLLRDARMTVGNGNSS